MDAIKLLTEDHETIKDLMSRIEQTTERAEKGRDELFERLARELEAHSHIEEQIFYPAIKEQSETREITLEGIEEHHVVHRLMQELAFAPKTTEQWSAKFKVLRENVEHHIEEEEGEMFKGARKVLDKAQLEELGTRMEAERRTFLQARAIGE